MMKTSRFADIHIHCLPDIDKGIAMLKEISDFGIKDMNILAITYHEFPIDAIVLVAFNILVPLGYLIYLIVINIKIKKRQQ